MFPSTHDLALNGDYEGQHRRHFFGRLVLGIIAALILGSVLLFLIGFFFGFVPFLVFRPFVLFPLGFLIFILFLFVIVRFAFWGWGWRRWGGYRSSYWLDSKEILRQRYARGEISKEQFDQMMRDIGASK
jgi:putative membrane protein